MSFPEFLAWQRLARERQFERHNNAEREKHGLQPVSRRSPGNDRGPQEPPE